MSHPDHSSDSRLVREDQIRSEYWRRNLQYVGILLSIWFAVSYGAGILFVDTLNEITVPGTGFPLGFWFAQQGSIYVFVVLIFVYVFLMNRLDRAFEVDEIDASYEYFQSKGIELTDIQTRNDGQRAFYLNDLDGNRIEICTVSGFGVLV